MSMGFEGTKGRATVSVTQRFVVDEGGTLAVSFPGWHHAIEVYAHAADGSMAIGEANAGLVAEAFNTLDETGLTPRQLAEQRAELLADAERYRWLKQFDVGIGSEGYGDYTYYAYADPCPQNGRLGLDASIDAAIANATQQRNATGGEG